MAANDYDDYVRLEWEKFVSDPSRARASLEATSPMEVKRVLDVGCGAGQELLQFGVGGIGVSHPPSLPGFSA